MRAALFALTSCLLLGVGAATPQNLPAKRVWTTGAQFHGKEWHPLGWNPKLDKHAKSIAAASYMHAAIVEARANAFPWWELCDTEAPRSAETVEERQKFPDEGLILVEGESKAVRPGWVRLDVPDRTRRCQRSEWANFLTPESVTTLVDSSDAILPTGLMRRGETDRWVGTWAASPQLTEPANMPPEPGLADSTLRQVVHVSLGGKRLRIRFSNAFGTKPLTILSAHVAASAGGGAIKPGTSKPLTFGGRSSVTIPTGAPMVSDPINFDLDPLSDLAVTIRVKDRTEAITGHPGARCTSYLQGGDEVVKSDLPQAARTSHWYYLCGVDVEDAEAAAVAVLGDSITDGRGSPTDGNGRWTDHLAILLRERQGTAHTGVLNQGLGGNRMLTDGLGPNALARLDRDVLAQPGVRWLIVLEGINDLGTASATAPDLIHAYEQIIQRSHARGIQVFGATLMPCEGANYFNPVFESARQQVNAWIRDAKRFDAVIDFDAATRDLQRPSHLSAEVDGGDHLHPSPGGYKIMASGVDLNRFAQ